MSRKCIHKPFCILFIYFTSLFDVINGDELFGPKFKPTKGALWPQPQFEIKESIYFTVQGDFQFQVTGHTCDILANALERYGFVLRDTRRTAARLFPSSRSRREVEVADEEHAGTLEQLQVDLTAPCEAYPYFGMQEAYNLTIDVSSVLRSESIWGILRGLESWAQLFYFNEDGPEVRINKTSILDAPFYPHRGLLIDTSRHYISLSKILTTLDAMAMSKLNVLHWHIVDDQSFPYQSDKFPELSRHGAYHSSLVYSKADIQRVVAYARERGIRVLPEFDVPGHTRSWGESHPELLTECYAEDMVEGLGPMNPLSNATYTLLQELFHEIQEWFPERYLHVGGDEVNLDCWVSNPDLQKYMRDHNLTEKQLHGVFMSRVIPLLGPGIKPIVWQEVFDEGVQLPTDTIVHVWKNDNVASIVNAGYRVIYSTAWYLDHLSSGGDWEKMYTLQPQGLASTGLVGGEAAMWGEVVDDTNVISRVWPRAAAVAEKLWTPPAMWSSYPSRQVYARLEEHTCRMRRRGIAAQPPSGPGYCLGAVL